jgi:DNA-binding CsgD family transcriptional regulator/N-acetylneuraminic acid mutarotase
MTEKDELSSREREILKLVALGMTNREIAQELSISPNTVKVHLSNIFAKTGVASRTEATLYGMEQGIVDAPGGGQNQADETWRSNLKIYRWLLIPLSLLMILIVITLVGNVFAPAPDPQLQSAEAAMAERWQELAPMPEARAGMAAVTYGGEIYAIAGEGPEGVSGSVFAYNPEVDQWRQLSDKPTPVTDVEGVLIGEKIYIPGGRTASGEPTNILEVYDPRSNSWAQGEPLPKAISSYALAGFEGKLYLFGGWDGEKALESVYVFDPIEEIWYERSEMGIAKHDHGAIALTNKILVFGGKDGEAVLKDVGVYYPSRDGNGGRPWDDFVDLPEDQYQFGVVSISDTIFIFGGKKNESSTDIESKAYQFIDQNWQEIEPEIYQGIINPKLVAIGTKIYIFSNLDLGNRTYFWTYQAYYFETFLPIIQ